jgi:hypothetical protein
VKLRESSRYRQQQRRLLLVGQTLLSELAGKLQDCITCWGDAAAAYACQGLGVRAVLLQYMSYAEFADDSCLLSLLTASKVAYY